MKQRITQRDRILRLLESRRGEWVPLYEITPLAAQYNTRVRELRGLGHRIENRMEHHEGQVHSWFRIPKPESQSRLFPQQLEEGQHEHYLEVVGKRI